MGKVAPPGRHRPRLIHGECDQADMLSTICRRDTAHIGLRSVADLHLIAKESDRPPGLAAIQPLLIRQSRKLRDHPHYALFHAVQGGALTRREYARRGEGRVRLLVEKRVRPTEAAHPPTEQLQHAERNEPE